LFGFAGNDFATARSNGVELCALKRAGRADFPTALSYDDPGDVSHSYVPVCRRKRLPTSWRAISPVTDFGNKFIPSPFNSLQPPPHLAAPAFCAALFYPEFANEYFRRKSARQPGFTRTSRQMWRWRNRGKFS
jgi:hypothetical protein